MRCVDVPAVGLRSAASRVSAEWLLSLAAAPTFALMALLSGIHAGGMPGMSCAAAHEASPLTGMAAMYLLMSAFHSLSWLRLIRQRRRSLSGDTFGKRAAHARQAPPEQRQENNRAGVYEIGKGTV